MSGRPGYWGSKEYRYYYCPTAVEGLVVDRTCEMKYFRSDQVDAAVWEWVGEILQHPEALRDDLKEQQAERERENQPLRDRLAVLDDLLAENRRQLEKLLDLYLGGDFSKEVLTERKARLETTIAALEKERADLMITLESQTLTDAQIMAFEEYARKVASNLEKVEGNFRAKRQLIDELDVRVKLTIQNGHARSLAHACWR
jgi:chromosome segregation ATPase